MHTIKVRFQTTSYKQLLIFFLYFAHKGEKPRDLFKYLFFVSTFYRKGEWLGSNFSSRYIKMSIWLKVVNF